MSHFEHLQEGSLAWPGDMLLSLVSGVTLTWFLTILTFFTMFTIISEELQFLKEIQQDLSRKCSAGKDFGLCKKICVPSPS